MWPLNTHSVADIARLVQQFLQFCAGKIRFEKSFTWIFLQCASQNCGAAECPKKLRVCVEQLLNL